VKERALAALVMVSIVGFFLAAVTAIGAGAMLAYQRASRPDTQPVAVAEEVDPAPARTTKPAALGASATPPQRPAPTSAAAQRDARNAADDRGACPAIAVTGIDDKLVVLRAKDPQRVEPMLIFAQAHELAVALDRDAKLVSIRVSRVIDGFAELLGPDEVTFSFEYFRYARSDAHETGTVVVRAGCWGLYARADRSVRLDKPTSPERLRPPACTLQRAWLAAVAQGLSDMMAVSARFEHRPLAPTGDLPVWTFEIPGQAEGRRDVHGQTCAALRDGGTVGAAVPDAGARAGAGARIGARADAGAGAGAGAGMGVDAGPRTAPAQPRDPFE
jgi:hypothetical protein